MKFLDLFEKIEFSEKAYVTKNKQGQEFVEFPGDFHSGIDLVAVPLLEKTIEEIDAAKLVIAAAVDRNIIIYDEESEPANFTVKLVNIMKQTMLRNGGGNYSGYRGRLTDLFISKKYWSNTQDICGVKIHLVEEKDWDELREYYEKDLYGFLYNKKDFIIGVSLELVDSFVHPINTTNGNEGLAILNNRKVLLGLI